MVVIPQLKYSNKRLVSSGSKLVLLIDNKYPIPELVSSEATHDPDGPTEVKKELY